ncbi:MAG: hypothetical protein LBU96_13120 [Yokenella regensburgei]|jgi:hypothetical protein|nr:hypothetical protein [Yokenella regensburgei]
MFRILNWLFGQEQFTQRKVDIPDYQKISYAEKMKINNVIKARALMAPIKVRHFGSQPPAPKSKVFELLCMGPDNYYFRGDPAPVVDGIFIFVILASDPGRILCGVPQNDSMANEVNKLRFGIFGHASISLREDVLYAGEILFDNGALCLWTNKSGHYLPMAQTRLVNLLPNVQRILLPDAFIDFRNPPDWFINALYGER